VCVELTGRFGLGASEHLRPFATEAGIVLVPIDRATISLVWSDRGYPAAGAYRDYHHHTVHHHNPWCNDGGSYDHPRALALAREHAADFVGRTIERLRTGGGGLPGGGLAVFAVDTELLGHWWYEGVAWLEAVVDECARQGLELVRLDDALERHEPTPGRGLEDGAVSSWGEDGELSTWSGPPVADIAFQTRAAELKVLAGSSRIGMAAVRELLALQASDWAFMVSRGIASSYARERFDGHQRRLSQALEAGRSASVEGLRNLAPYADRASLLGS
jgi:1,4-alpha-glucan branching enzyme